MNNRQYPFKLQIFIKHNPKCEIRVYIDDAEINYSEDYKCYLTTLDNNDINNHHLKIIQIPSSRVFSYDKISVLDKVQQNELKSNRLKLREKYSISIVSCIFETEFSVKKDSMLVVEFKRKYYSNYLGMQSCYYLGNIDDSKGIKFIKHSSDIYWTKKNKIMHYSIVQLKNTLIFLFVIYSFIYQAVEGFSFGDNFIVGGLSGYTQMFFSLSFIAVFAGLYIYFSIKLFQEYKCISSVNGNSQVDSRK